VHKLGLPCKTPISRRGWPHRGTGRITPKNSEVDRGDALAFRSDHIAVVVSVTSTKSICPARHQPASRADDRCHFVATPL
jgi:hypothetical protein